jgi:hypothetical protein
VVAVALAAGRQEVVPRTSRRTCCSGGAQTGHLPRRVVAGHLTPPHHAPLSPEKGAEVSVQASRGLRLGWISPKTRADSNQGKGFHEGRGKEPMPPEPVRHMALLGSALLTGLLLTAGAAAQDCDQCGRPCPPWVKHRLEGAPRLKFKHGCPRPLCDPCNLPHYGYFQTCWHPWPFPPDCPRCPGPAEAVPEPQSPPRMEPAIH